MNKVPDNFAKVPGSERIALPNARKVQTADPDELILVTVLVRRPPISSLVQSMNAKALAVSERSFLSRERFKDDYGADREDLKKVEQFAQKYGLTVKETDEAAGTMILSGSVEAFGKAFQVELFQYEHPDFTYRGRTGHVHIPEDLVGIVEAVLGLDNRPQTWPYIRLLENSESLARSDASRVSYTPPQVAQLYHFPTETDCSRQCIGIIELGGGYHSDDITNYFTSLKLPIPKVIDVSVDGAHNAPTGDPGGPDGEVALDIEVAAAVAPNVRVAVYFAPNTDSGFMNAISKAIHDKVNKPSVISISWGNSESEWTLQAMQAMNRVFQDAAALGVTICCASGDRGSSDGVSDNRLHVDFPASSPYVLGCGGTRLQGSANTIKNEVVWNEGRDSGTGGGVSDVFDLPGWQSAAHVPVSANPGGRKGRGVPDVAGNADPVTGYEVLVDGQKMIIGGTSAVAPLWAGLFAILNEKLGHPVGFVNPALYGLAAKDGAFHDIVSGNNDTNRNKGAYSARPGWDACTGLGSPNGTNLLKALSKNN